MTTLAVAASAGAIWLLGHFVFELLVPDESQIRSWSGTELLFAKVAIAALLVAWPTLVLVQTGLFSQWTLAISIAGLLGVFAILLRRSARKPFENLGFLPDAAFFIAVGLVVVGVFLYAPRFEQVIGERDPSTYVLTGVSIARTGSLAIHDPVIARLSEAERTEFIGSGVQEHDYHHGTRFPGWYLVDLDTGRVLPQGFPLYPSVIAIGFLIGDMDGALRVTSFLAMCAAVALFFLGRRVFGWAVGLTAAAFLLVAPSQVWFSRYANAEAPAQLLAITGIYGLVVFRNHRAAAYGLLAALSFGLSWQAHIWTIWLVFPLLGLLILDLARGRLGFQEMLAFWGPLGVLGLHALAVGAFFERPYLASILTVLNSSRSVWVLMVSAIFAVLVVCWWWGRRREPAATPAPEAADPWKPDGSAIVVWPRRLVAAGLVAIAVYGYWIRPAISNAWRAESVERLVLAITAPVFWLAVAGAVLVTLDRRRRNTATVLLAISVGLTVPVLANPNITRPLMWSLRRFQTFLPLVFLMASAAIWWAANRARERRAPAAVVSGLVVLCTMVAGGMAWSLGATGAKYRGFEQPGPAVATVEAIAASLEEDAVLVFEPRSGSALLGFAPALAYWKGFDVVWLHRKVPDTATLRSFVLEQERQGRHVYYFTQGVNHFFAEPRLVPHRQWVFRQQALEEVRQRLPDELRSNDVLFASYLFEPVGENEPLDGGLDVGEWDDIYVGEVFATEMEGDMTTRWTRGTSYFWLPGLDDAASEIVVHADSFVDRATYPRTLRARLDGVDLGEIPIRKPWRDYVFEVPSGWQPAEGVVPRLELSTEAIQPDQIVGNGDTRYLGVKVNAILWR